MVKNILCIDFNYIMYPYIKLYQDKVNIKENCTVIWNNLDAIYEIDKVISYDPNALKTIVNILKIAFNNGANIIPIESQDKIVDLLREADDYEDSKYNILNVDFYTDIINRRSELASLKNFGKYNMSNWLGYLIMLDKVESLKLMLAPNSIPYDQSLYEFKNIEYIKLFNYIDSINTFIKDNNVSEVYFSLSPQFVPYKYKHLYDMLVDIFKKEE